jgi:hypothetical protein
MELFERFLFGLFTPEPLTLLDTVSSLQTVKQIIKIKIDIAKAKSFTLNL